MLVLVASPVLVGIGLLLVLLETSEGGVKISGEGQFVGIGGVISFVDFPTAFAFAFAVAVVVAAVFVSLGAVAGAELETNGVAQIVFAVVAGDGKVVVSILGGGGGGGGGEE